MKKIGLMMTLLALLTLTACGVSSSKKETAGKSKLEAIKESGKLVIATSPDFPPMEFYILNDKKEKEIVGSDIQLAKAIADKIGVTLDIKATDFNGVLANVQTNSVDMGISGFVATAERANVMDFSDGYLQEASSGFQGILTTKEVAETYTTLDALKAANITVGAQGGTIQFETSGQITDAKNIKQYGTMDAAVLALNAGDIKAVAVSTSSVEPLLTSFPNLVILPKDGFNLDKEDKFNTNVIGIPKGDDNASFVQLINEVIKENKDSGSIVKWREDAEKQAIDAIK